MALALEAISLLCASDALEFYAAWRVVTKQLPDMPPGSLLGAQWVSHLWQTPCSGSCGMPALALRCPALLAGPLAGPCLPGSAPAARPGDATTMWLQTHVLPPCTGGHAGPRQPGRSAASRARQRRPAHAVAGSAQQVAAGAQQIPTQHPTRVPVLPAALKETTITMARHPANGALHVHQLHSCPQPIPDRR